MQAVQQQARQAIEDPCRVPALAVIGAGPRGMYCLERLAAHLSRHKLPPRLSIDIYEPHPFPGAGPVYDPRLPNHFRMNYAAENVSAWLADNDHLSGETTLSLVAWLTRFQSAWSAQRYVPRAVVGEYLHWCYQQIAQSFPSEVELRRIRARVKNIQRAANGWQVTLNDHTTDPQHYQEILITTGHATSRVDSFVDRVRNAPAGKKARIYRAVVPHASWLSEREVPSGSTVGVRGFGLTFIDAALALTEGRGGRFEPGPTPCEYQYHPSPGDVRRIIPFSRTGLPPIPKPEMDYTHSTVQLSAVWEQGRSRVWSVPPAAKDGVNFVEDLLPILLETAAEALTRIIH